MLREQVFGIFVSFIFFGFVITNQGWLIHLIIELADQSSCNACIIFLAATCNMDNAMK